jgi:hypothetical protein
MAYRDLEQCLTCRTSKARQRIRGNQLSGRGHLRLPDGSCQQHGAGNEIDGTPAEAKRTGDEQDAAHCESGRIRCVPLIQRFVRDAQLFINWHPERCRDAETVAVSIGHPCWYC